MRKWVCLVLVLVGMLYGCVRSEGTDLVLFCESFNHKAPLKITEQDAMRRSETEWVLSVEGMLIRLQTSEDASIQSVIVTAPANNPDLLTETARCAFEVLADSVGETVPESILSVISRGTDKIEKTDTAHFQYLCYASPEAVTVQQRLSPSDAVTAPPSLRR